MDGLQDLQSYINAEYDLRMMEQERLTQRDIIFSSQYSQYEVIGGIPRYYCSSVEQAAFSLIELDEAYENASKKYLRKRQLLQGALTVLGTEELEAFNRLVWGNESNLALDQLNLYGNRAKEKLCSYIEHKNETLEIKQWEDHRQSLRKQIEEYKQSTTVV